MKHEYTEHEEKRNNGANSPFQLGEADRKHIAGIGVDVPCAKRGQKVRKSSIRKLKQDVKAYELGELPPEEFNRKYESRKGHLGHADTYHIAKAVEYELLFYEWERLEATA